MSDGNQFNTPEREEKGSAHVLLLSLIRSVVEKYGGSITIDEKNDTFTITIPESRREACLQELEQVIGPSEPLSESSFSLH